MGVPERGGGNKVVYCLNQLTNADSPIGRTLENVLKGTLYYQLQNIKIQEGKQNKVK
jgi:hypothetical protein